MVTADPPGRRAVSPGPSPAVSTRRAGTGGRPLLRRAAPYLLIAPTVLALTAVLGYPLVELVLLSFQDMSRRELFAGTEPPWTGLKQYRAIAQDRFFWQVVGRTALFATVCTALTMAAALAVALLMRRVSPWVRATMAAVLVAVWAMPVMVAASVFRWLADADYGVANWLLGLLPGLDFTKHNWFEDPWQGFAVIVAVVFWGSLPFAAITLQAALTQVPPELAEAARVDGAGRGQVFRHITFPVVKPAFVMVTTLNAIWNFGVFNQIWLMRSGQPEKEYYLLGVYSFIESFAVNRYSAGAAIAVVTVVLLLAGAVFYVRQLVRMGETR
ncbi:carbohydrate ABC transporter permease [Streptomyces yaizuensis]|uniref:Sugar ABC transporter permease n=1 Tax=Streptomyces yaizuensis TaxID=2989713 RepID=A0ABQ5NQN2_9ACTN|nr:sugar ABC transporter permease [Streptomyces sp. YSPA8]GLF92698.1 sugar ABC transporter permease [Streptomyces sp. YSPA8]